MTMTSERLRTYILEQAWENMQTIDFHERKPSTWLDKLLASLGKMPRVVLLLIDAFGLTIEETAKLVQHDEASVKKILAEARQQFVN